MTTGPGWRLFRDPAGVPHVQAENLSALAHGHGYVTGLDRAWYAEVLRRRAEARSAELVGPEAFDGDQLSLAADVVGTARRWWQAASSEDREFLAAYARGISAALAEVWEGTPEAREAGVAHEPVRPWDPWTPLAVHLDAHLLTGSLPEQLWRRRVRALLGEAWLPVLDAESPAAAGSNAWLVPGELSVTGSPLLAADPHRLVEESGPYQPVCLSTPRLRVRGLALVGLPGVPHFGRTESAAWAITAAMTVTERVTEVPVENRHGTWVLTRTGEALERHRAVLRARDGVERTCSVWRCAAGFVLPGVPEHEALLDAAAHGSTARVTVVSPAPVADPARAFAACRESLEARTADDVVAAFSGWAVPCDDLLAADAHGACRNAVAGAFLGTPEPPRALDAITVRANQRPTAPAASASRLACASPHRARRAAQLLEEAVAAHGVVRHEDLLAAQLDTAAPHWPPLLRRLLGEASCERESSGAGTPDAPDTARNPGRTAAADAAPPAVSPAAARAREHLLAWDGSMAADSTGASWFAVWREALVRELVAHTALRALDAPTGMPTVWDPFLHGVGRVGLAVENVIRCGPALGVDVTGCALAALDRVAEEHRLALPPSTGRDEPAAPVSPRPRRHRADWSDDAAAPDCAPATSPSGEPTLPAWGVLHAFTPWRSDPAMTPADPVPVGGDTDCLLAAGTLPGVGPACLRVPAARVLWDLADPAASWWITPDPVARGESTEAPVHRWARGETDQALPWVPAGAVGPLGRTLDLGALQLPEGGSEPATRAALRPVDPRPDAALLHEWVSAPRARFWGMGGLGSEQVREVYEYLAASPTHHAWIVEVNGEPTGLFQTYEPHADPVGAAYRVEPGDLGIHVLLAPTGRPRRGLTGALGRAVLEQVARHGTTWRIVAEPDVSNDRALERAAATGFELGPAIELPGKTGRLAFLTLPPARGS
ncbi:GNAT family N-acetyltransferase [Kocuria sp.]|uniref:GNAT family N-acetyltransferase n=1 Tax=Kocuria sp. TaxID=1871328 RepID=UPI0026DD5BEB|nr:GNAT family N-acetyltransferase [Kocuria sp.]MDO4918465.1 GNAT family N-acetyltransferase [Kocuria sp.]